MSESDRCETFVFDAYHSGVVHQQQLNEAMAKKLNEIAAAVAFMSRFFCAFRLQPKFFFFVNFFFLSHRNQFCSLSSSIGIIQDSSTTTATAATPILPINLSFASFQVQRRKQNETQATLKGKNKNGKGTSNSYYNT